MAATTRITLDLDTVALSLARRAAELDDTTVSAVVSSTLARHLLTDYAPTLPPDPDRDRREAQAAIADAELEATATRHDDEHPS